MINGFIEHTKQALALFKLWKLFSLSKSTPRKMKKQANKT